MVTEFTAQIEASYFSMGRMNGVAGKFDGANLQGVTTDGGCFLFHRGSKTL